MIFKTLLYVLLLFSVRHTANAQQPDEILGRWISAQNNVIVEISRDSSGFMGRVAWFDDSDNKNQPMNTRVDVNNPVKALQGQKIIGLVILKELVFNAKCKCWQEGKIYDVQSGKTWSASISLLNLNLLKVRGFWHYEFLGKSMIFRRVK